jgi:hypothetical protein
VPAPASWGGRPAPGRRAVPPGAASTGYAIGAHRRKGSSCSAMQTRASGT